jgi:predicted secreted protein
VAGALINVVHPASKQRYTAAHELAHHRRDRSVVLDEDTEWLGRDDGNHSDREKFAEAFASWFLMPMQLVAVTLRSLGFRPGSLTPSDVYQVALELGTSYSATAAHLFGLHMASSAQLAIFRATSPMVIKEELGGRGAAEDLRRDVWHVRSSEPPRELRPQAGDVVVVDRSEVGTAGYSWYPEDEGRLRFVNDDYELPSGDRLVGSPLIHRFRFIVDSAGATTLRLALRRPWEDAATRESDFNVDAVERPAAGIASPRLLVENTND